MGEASPPVWGGLGGRVVYRSPRTWRGGAVGGSSKGQGDCVSSVSEKKTAQNQAQPLTRTGLQSLEQILEITKANSRGIFTFFLDIRRLPLSETRREPKGRLWMSHAMRNGCLSGNRCVWMKKQNHCG